LLGYTPHDISYRVYNIETNTVVESYGVTFDETAPCPRDAFECAGDKEMEENIFIDEGLRGVDGDEDKSLLPSTLSPEHVLTKTLKADALQATTSYTTAVEASCDRTTLKMRGLSPKIISGDSRRSENAQTHTNKHTIPNMKFKFKLLHIKCHVLGLQKSKPQKVLQKS
jgi:hypothetical protein